MPEEGLEYNRNIAAWRVLNCFKLLCSALLCLSSSQKFCSACSFQYSTVLHICANFLISSGPRWPADKTYIKIGYNFTRSSIHMVMTCVLHLFGTCIVKLQDSHVRLEYSITNDLLKTWHWHINVRSGLKIWRL